MDDDIEDQLVEVLAEEDEANTMNYASQFQRYVTKFFLGSIFQIKHPLYYVSQQSH